MPELPDILAYRDALEQMIVGQTIVGVDQKSPFVVRTFEPDLSEIIGQQVISVSRLGKRLVWQLEAQTLVFHLMIAGRFHQRKPGTKPRSKTDLLAFHFGKKEASDGPEIVATLFLTEAGTKKRASLHVLNNPPDMAPFMRAGIDVLTATSEAFAERLRSENHTLKRTLTDPRLFDGIGNAYSDEILHAARLSPIRWTSRLTDEEVERLFQACQSVLTMWIDRLAGEAKGKFPEKVTAFRPEMAVHGKYKEPCPVCATLVQRIRYADNETNYCPRCQTDGKLLADRSLSRLLKNDWPKTIEALEEAD